MNNRIQAKNFRCELYPDNFEHQIALDELGRRGFLYSAILHDKDEGVKPHWDIVMVFPRKRWLSAVASDLGIAEKWLEPCKSLTACQRYHCHLDNPDKYQYDPCEIFGSNAEAVRALYEGGKTEDSKVQALLFLLDTMPSPCTYRQFIVACCDAGLYGTLRRMGSLFKPLFDEHNWPPCNLP